MFKLPVLKIFCTRGFIITDATGYWLVLASISDVWAMLLVKATAEEELRLLNVKIDEGESL